MQRSHTIYVVYWDKNGQDTYLYGSGVIFKKDGSVFFENERMPSGFSMKRWSSRTSFGRDHCEPSLPLLQEGVTYLVRPCMQVSPPGTVLLRMEFFDRQGQRISYLFLEGEMPSFEVPEGTWYYDMELIQSGSKRLIFYGLLLCEDDPLLRRNLERWNQENFLEKSVQIERRRMFQVTANGERGRNP